MREHRFTQSKLPARPKGLQFSASFMAGRDPPYETVCFGGNHRCIGIFAYAQQLMIEDPEGGVQDVRRFSMRQDASSKNPGHVSVGRFELDLSVFFGDFLCAKESYPRKARKLCCYLPITRRLASPHSTHLLHSPCLLNYNELLLTLNQNLSWQLKV